MNPLQPKDRLPKSLAPLPKFIWQKTWVHRSPFKNKLIINQMYKPASSKWPFDHKNGGHLTPEKVT